jgi:hypothetical protein
VNESIFSEFATDVIQVAGLGFIDWLEDLQVLAHYFTGPFVPNTRAKYCREYHACLSSVNK